MDLDSIFGNVTGQKISLLTPLEIFNNQEKKRQLMKVNHSILKNTMHKWTNVVDDQAVEDTKINKKLKISKPLGLNSLLSHSVNYEENSVVAGLMKNIYNNEDKKLGQVNPGDRHRSSIKLLQKERSDRRHREQMMSKSRISHKIKSKNFHRHQKKRSIKDYLRNEESVMQGKGDLMEDTFDKMRAEERISLKHKVGGKFAKIQKLRAKYDPNAREALSNMRDQGKTLTEKRVVMDDEEEIESDITNQYEDEVSEDEDEGSEDEGEGSGNKDEGSADEEMMAGLKRKLDCTYHQKQNQFSNVNQSKSEKPIASTKTGTISTSQSHFLNYDDHDSGELCCNDEQKFKEAIYEIYQGDEQLAEQFANEKASLVEKENPKDFQTFVPGWGSWTGPGLEAADKRRLKRGLVKAPDTNRKDKKKPRVWIKEGVSDELKKHLIKKIPYPYNTAEQFNLSRQQLISRSFNLESVHRKLIKPKYIKKSGEIILPRKKNF